MGLMLSARDKTNGTRLTDGQVSATTAHNSSSQQPPAAAIIMLGHAFLLPRCRRTVGAYLHALELAHEAHTRLQHPSPLVLL